jgi:ABC-2 type transport system permease protein
VKYVYIALIAGIVIAVRIGLLRARGRRRTGREVPQDVANGTDGVAEPASQPARASVTTRTRRRREVPFGDVGQVAAREIKERVRGRIFRIGTLVILIAVGAAIIIPTLHHGGGLTSQKVGVVGNLSPKALELIHASATANQDTVTVVSESSLARAKDGLRSGALDLVIVGGSQILLNEPASSSNSPADSGLVQSIAQYLGVLKAFDTAHLTPAQAGQVISSRPVPVHTLVSGAKSTTKTTSVIGIVLLFIMLTQYNTWILIGVMQEKSSRVVEVLLATVRPLQLLGGKVLGIGTVALGQATLIVGFAFVVAKAVGSDLLHGTAPLVLASELLWLILGYAFYCWVYAAGGSTAERQDQVQTLAFPLSIPILVGYIFSITVASSGHSSLLFKVLAYFPPTAPFCMPVLVGLHQVSWWEFLGSALISLAGTAAMALFAARIYRRAVLRTGGRVRVRQLLGRSAR